MSTGHVIQKRKNAARSTPYTQPMPGFSPDYPELPPCSQYQGMLATFLVELWQRLIQHQQHCRRPFAAFAIRVGKHTTKENHKANEIHEQQSSQMHSNIRWTNTLLDWQIFGMTPHGFSEPWRLYCTWHEDHYHLKCLLRHLTLLQACLLHLYFIIILMKIK